MTGLCRGNRQRGDGRNRAAALLVLGTILFGASLAGANPSVRVLGGPAKGIRGPAAAGRAGDILLENGMIRVVLSSPDHALGSALSGGRIIDAAPVGGEDSWGQSLLLLTDEFPRQARYDEMELIEPGSRGGVAGVRFIGSDSRIPDITVTTEYLLAGGERFVTIRTSYEWPNRRALEEGIVIDRIEVGAASPFLPGHGFLSPGEPAERDVPPGTPLLLLGEGVAYGWSAPDVAVVSPFREGAVQLRMEPFQLPGRSTKTFERRLFVHTGDPAGLIPLLDPGPRVRLEGVVTGKEGGAPLPGALVEIADGAGPRTIAVTGEDGRFHAFLPPDLFFTARPFLPGSGVGSSRRFRADPGDPPRVDLRLEEGGIVRFRIADDGGVLLPGKVVIRDEDGTRRSGEKGLLPPRETVYTESGEGLFTLPPGRYRLFAAHGVEYSMDSHDVETESAETTDVAFRIVREAPAEGLAAVDLCVHTVASMDSPVLVEEHLLAAKAEGIDALVVTDRGRVIGRVPSRSEDRPLLLSGEELFLHSVGRFGAFPLRLEDEVLSTGGYGVEGKAPARIFSILRSRESAPLIHIHDPREPVTGYFNAMGLDPESGLSTNIEYDDSFDLVEVASGRSLERAGEVLSDWFHLLDMGRRVFATGNSGARTHQIGSVGVPCNWVEMGGAKVTAESLVEAIREGRFFFSTGPLLRFRVNGDGRPGDLVPDEDGLVDLSIRVDAPSWMGVDEVRIFGNGGEMVTISNGFRSRERRESIAIYRDTWFVAVASGNGDLDPIYTGPEGEPVFPVAVSNPVWVDFNGNGRFDGPGPN